MSLIEKAEAALDQDQAAEMQKKLKKMDFDFNDYLTSMEQMNKMGRNRKYPEYASRCWRKSERSGRHD